MLNFLIFFKYWPQVYPYLAQFLLHYFLCNRVDVWPGERFMRLKRCIFEWYWFEAFTFDGMQWFICRCQMKIEIMQRLFWRDISIIEGRYRLWMLLFYDLIEGVQIERAFIIFRLCCIWFLVIVNKHTKVHFSFFFRIDLVRNIIIFKLTKISDSKIDFFGTTVSTLFYFWFSFSYSF